MPTLDRITSQCYRKMSDTKSEITLMNGCYNVVKRKVNTMRGILEIRVEVTHPLLEWQCGNNKDIEVIFWKYSCGAHHDHLKNEFLSIIKEMKKEGEMTDTEASEISQKNASMFAEAWAKIGITA